MLSGESTLLQKGSIELWEADARLSVDGAHQVGVLFGDTKAQRRAQESLCVRLMVVVSRSFFAPASALRKTGSSAQSESTPTTSNLSPSLDPFSLSLSPAWYVRVKGIKRGLVGGGSKLLLDYHHEYQPPPPNHQWN